MRLESRRDVVSGPVGFAVAWVLLWFVAPFLVEGSPNTWWLVPPTVVVVYLLVRRFGGVIRGRP